MSVCSVVLLMDLPPVSPYHARTVEVVAAAAEREPRPVFEGFLREVVTRARRRA